MLLRWRIFTAWLGEADAGSRRDYYTAHRYLRLRIRLERKLADRKARR